MSHRSTPARRATAAATAACAALALTSIPSIPSIATARDSAAVHSRRDVTSDASIRVNNTAGSLRVAAWEKNELAISGELGDGVDRIDVSGPPERVEVRVVMKKLTVGDGEADLLLQVPRGCRLEIQTVSADVEARDLANKLDIEAVSGDVQVSGRLRELSLRTVSGEVVVKSVAERSALKTVSGDITLVDASGELELESVSGEIRVSGEAFSRVRAKTVSGDLQISGDLKRESAVDIESHSGEVVLGLPPNTAGIFDMSTFSGTLESEIGEDTARDIAKSEGHGPGRKLRFTLGTTGDAARISIKTFSGDVHIKRR